MEGLKTRDMDYIIKVVRQPSEKKEKDIRTKKGNWVILINS